MIYAYGVTQQGTYHIKNNIVCQDAHRDRTQLQYLPDIDGERVRGSGQHLQKTGRNCRKKLTETA